MYMYGIIQYYTTVHCTVGRFTTRTQREQIEPPANIMVNKLKNFIYKKIIIRSLQHM